MKSVNKVTLLGNVGKDPEVKALGSGTAVANFSIATENRFKKDGEWQSSTEWHNLVAYGRLAEIIRDYVRKGAKLYIEGRIQTRSWDQDGQRRYRTEIVAGDVVLLGDNHGGGNSGGYRSSAPASSYDDLAGEITDDDIPF